MLRLLIAKAALTLAYGLIASAAPAAELDDPIADGMVASSSIAAADETANFTSDGTYSGTASVQCECDDGSCIVVKCSVSAAASYESAKSSLEAKIESEISSRGGKKKGSISFSITLDLGVETSARVDSLTASLTFSESPEQYSTV